MCVFKTMPRQEEWVERELGRGQAVGIRGCQLPKRDPWANGPVTRSTVVMLE